ncbi:hypothetical protein CGLO_17082 [Colletotrichum gloeosporioides Cg-14]|uniref:Uncharacterized protein n=1 Tax=Colletotrichum gloeosporioides (strain Cg-14) TaxID=1237896 RepID=T0JUF7_COLGC|nr:hypothetical protein CGLO_17082 [Colletotrichum gloeosporioides Cg-14]
MQTARYFITAAVKFTASVKNSHNDLYGRTPHFLMNSNRNPAAIIFYSNASSILLSTISHTRW